MRYFVFTLCLFISSIALGYIPPSYFILDQLVDHHGRGNYQLTQEVQVRTAEKDYLYKETWWVESGRNMLVKIEAPHGTHHILYKGKKKYYIDKGGNLQSQDVSKFFVEPLFHYRSLSLLKNDLTEKGVLQPGQVRPPIKYTKKEDLQYKKEPFVKLARNRGTITYVLGDIQNMAEIKPTIWVEQDRFVIRRLRLANNLDVLADNYEDYSAGMSFPKSRTIRWANGSAQIELIRAETFSNKKAKELLRTSQLSKLENKLKDYDPGAQIQEYFKLFR